STHGGCDVDPDDKRVARTPGRGRLKRAERGGKIGSMRNPSYPQTGAADRDGMTEAAAVTERDEGEQFASRCTCLDSNVELEDSAEDEVALPLRVERFPHRHSEKGSPRRQITGVPRPVDRITIGRQPHHEALLEPFVREPDVREGVAAGGGEVRRGGGAHHMWTAQFIDGDAEADVNVDAAEIRGPTEPSIFLDPGHEGVSEAASEIGLEASGRGRERPAGRARYVSIAAIV